MRKNLSKLHYLLVALLLLTIVGCGANSNITDNGATGKITASLTYGTSKTAKGVAALPANVATVEATVTGTAASGGAIPVIKGVFTSSTGGTLSGITPGKVTLAVLAKSSSGTVLYEGYALNIVVTGGSQPSDAGTIAMTPPFVKTADTGCLSCHDTTLEGATGQNLVAAYKQSGHYPNSSAGCAACHGSAHNDPNPFDSGRCFQCHTPAQAMHNNDQTGTSVRPAEYLATNYAGKCTVCHTSFQHNTQSGYKDERYAWAKSGHGNVNGVAWSSEDLQIPAEIACQRCHTATGFKLFVAKNYSTAKVTTSVGSASDKTREVLACDACHTDNSFTMRSVPAFTVPYVANGGSNLFPDIGKSNLCVPCHSARGSQDVILKLSDAAMANTSFKNSHYMPAAGIMYLKAGFINFTSATSQVGSTFYKSYRIALSGVNAAGYPVNGGVDAQYGGISGGVSSAHRALGTPTIRGRETWMQQQSVYGLWETSGPCVTCHVKSDISHMPAVTTTATAPFLPAGTVIPGKRTASGHSLSAVSSDAGKQLCLPCHNDAQDFDVAMNQGDFAGAVEEKLAEAKPYFLGGLDVMTKLLTTKYNIKFDNATYPYFFDLKKDATGATAVTDWTRSGTLSAAAARKLLGACYNLKLLSADKGAYVHGRSYTQRLIFDSIDFLDDGVMNASAAATIVAVGSPTLFPSTAADHWLFKANGARK